MADTSPSSKDTSNRSKSLNQLMREQEISGVGPDDPRLHRVDLKLGDILFEQGDDGNSMYQVVAGMLGVRVREEDGTESVIARIAPGAVVGEMAMLTGQKRTATVFAINDAGLVRLDRDEFQKMSPEQQRMLFDHEALVIQRWQELQFSRVLQSLVGEVNVRELHRLRKKMEWTHLSNGDLLFEQGDEGDCMYIVVNGRIRWVTQNEAQETQIIGESGPGTTLGEFSLITEKPRTATTFAVRETDLVKITRQGFEQLANDHPDFFNQMTRIIIERYQEAIHPKPRVPETMTVTVLPASPQVEVVEFAGRLAEGLATYGKAAALDCEKFDQLFGDSGVSQLPLDESKNPAIITKLADLETQHNYLVYAADYELTPWTRRCIGQSDRVLVLAEPEGDPAPSEAEMQVEQMDVPLRKELVLWHAENTEMPSGTHAWLDPRMVRTHYHVRKNDQAHMDRLVRRLTGHAVALVLSTGGARGFAHVGVQKAMEELRIPIDYIGASSIGSVIGGFLCLYEKNEILMQHAAKFADPRKVFDRTLPFTAVMDSKKVTRFVQAVFGDTQIEDLWFPYFCVATNLTRAEAQVIERGPLWRAARASLAVPGFFTPVMEDGEVIVDGGIMDNFPVKLMAERTESDNIIAVHVNPAAREKRYYDFETHISGWKILFNRLNPFAKKLDVPSRTGIIMRTMDVNSTRQTREKEVLADLLIKPDVKRFKPSSYGEYVEITQVGYETALPALHDWKENEMH